MVKSNLLKKIQHHLKSQANLEKAKKLASFFKTKPGEYGYGDVFIGVPVPKIREIARKFYQDIAIADALILLRSKIHEQRMLALIILVSRYQKFFAERKIIFKSYLNNIRYINNWDLVDLTAQYIIGHYLLDKKRNILYRLARSRDIWSKRIAVVSTFAFIRFGEFTDTFELVKLLLADKHDLVHKACGWMLREIGKRGGLDRLENFLRAYCQNMPRVMLRYAIERFSENRRKQYLIHRNRGEYGFF